MNPPKCPFCSVIEWRHICGGVANKRFVANAVANRTAPQIEGTLDKGFPEAGRSQPADSAVSPGRPAAVAASRYKDLEKRKMYMREYMRKKRAKACS